MNKSIMDLVSGVVGVMDIRAMKPVKLGLISLYPEFVQVVNEISHHFPVELKHAKATLSDAVTQACQWQKEGAVDAIIARGATGAMIEKAVDLPVAVVDITSFDVIKALFRARDSGGPIGLVYYNWGGGEYDFHLFRCILKMDFQVYLFKNNEELNRQIELAVQDGMRTIVATVPYIAQKAMEHDVKIIIVDSSAEVVDDALNKAVHLVRIKREGAVFSEKLGNILDVVSDGVFAVDENDRLFFFNTVAEKLFRVLAREVLGKPVQSFKSLRSFALLYQDGEETIGEVVRLNGQELFVKRVPIRSEVHRFLVVSFQEVKRIQKMEEKIRQQLHAKGLVTRYCFEDIIGKSALVRDAVEQARRYATSGSTVLIAGESGTGKELFAQSIHAGSGRSQGPFVAVNCAALPENLLESELFGYEEGAFTNAKRGGKLGLFELAHGGTIFLDEIGEIGVQVQAKLLRVIQQREVMRLGGDRVIPVDVRVIATTNRNLSQAVENGLFRRDLYYRLNVLPLDIPPLRRRPEDILLLFRYFLINLWGMKAPHVPDKVAERLTNYPWPGNIRELENFAERYHAIGEEDPANCTTLQRLIINFQGSGEAAAASKALSVEVGTFAYMQRQILDQLAGMYTQDKNKLAKILGVSRSTLWRKISGAIGDHPSDQRQKKSVH